MLDRKGFMPIVFLDKEKFAGSMKGMRYRMEKKVLDPETKESVLKVTHWPEPNCYDATAEELKTSMETTYDEEGIQKGIDWLNDAFLSGYQGKEPGGF